MIAQRNVGVWRRQPVGYVVTPLGEMSLLIRIRVAGCLAHRQYQDNDDNPECDDDERDTD
ncbi:MAG: hypothetical protein ACLQA5_10510 [Solirubrobacteraceae bacterium]